MNKKIFFFDMDGTIVDRNSKIRPAVLSALIDARKKGHKLVIATGRPQSDILRDVDKNNFDYLVGNNGAYFFDVATGKFIDNGTVSKDSAIKTLELAKRNKSMFALHANRRAYRIIFDENYSINADKNNDPNFGKFIFNTEKEIRDIIEKHPIAQVSIRDTESNVIEFQDIIMNTTTDVKVHIANSIYLDVNPVNISKLVGVNSVLEKEGMSIDQAIAFGDSGNDIQMIKGVGYGIAMGNGTKELKKIADEVIGNNNSDAIAIKIKELI